MTPAAHHDLSGGYEAVAAAFMEHRDRSAIGVTTVRSWARQLRSGAAILDLGCGSGAPIAAALADDGFDVYGVDASPSLVAAFRARLPRAPVTCAAVEASSFFHRSFDAVIAIGLLFLLPAAQHERFLLRVAVALEDNGRFLFSAPSAVCTWTDLLTGRQSQSLGALRYAEMALERRLAPHRPISG